MKKLSEWLGALLCLLGVHDWEYITNCVLGRTQRVCSRCDKRQYWHVGHNVLWDDVQ